MSNAVRPRFKKNKKIKAWQHAFIALHALKIDWSSSTDKVLYVLDSNFQRAWRLDRGASPENWMLRYKGDTHPEVFVPGLWAKSIASTLTAPTVLGKLTQSKP